MPSDPLYGIKTITGETTILGKVVDLDGPMLTATIEVYSADKTWKFAISREIYDRLKDRLNKHVVLEGKACWIASTMEMIGFIPFDIGPYKETDAVTAFKELAEVSNGRWNGVDAMEYVRGLRDDD